VLLRLDDLLIDSQRQRVERDGVVLDVQGLTFQLLAYLVTRGVDVVTYDELMAAVWAPAIVNEETVTQRVKLLRQALGDDGRNPRYVRAVRGRGYQLCSMPIEAVDAARSSSTTAPDPAPLATSAPSSPPAIERKTLRVVAAFVGILGLIAGMATLWFAFSAKPGTPAADAPPSLTPTPGDEMLARARHYFQIGQKDDNERAIALYQQALAARPNDSAAQVGLSFAYSARVCLFDYEWTWAERAGELAQGVIAREPDNGLAHSARGYAYDCLGQMDGAIASYERAVAIDPAARWDSVASLANLYLVQGRLADALKLNLQAASHSTTLRFIDLQLARNVELLGDLAGADRRYRHGFQLQPDNVFNNAAWPAFLFRQGRFDEAATALATARTRPFHPELLQTAGELALARGDAALAAREFAAAAAMRPHQGKPNTLAHLYAREALDRAWIDRRIVSARDAIANGERWPDVWIELSWLEMSRGDLDAAVDALDGAIGAGHLDRAWLTTTPLLRRQRESPRFAALLGRIDARLVAERSRAIAAGWTPETTIRLKSD
jgi:DNA-binding winged helix-turn-helix (wHTH) protein/tetratricopeptide (TPR) repeat protein